MNTELVEHPAPTGRQWAGLGVLAIALADQTPIAIQALSDGFASATRWSIAVASLFLILGLVGALRLRKVASQPLPKGNVS